MFCGFEVSVRQNSVKAILLAPLIHQRDVGGTQYGGFGGCF